MNLPNIFFSIISLFLITLTSCTKNDDLIEVYLLKERIETNEGIPLSKIKEFKADDTYSKSFIEGTNYDTIKHEYIFAGKFEVTDNQMQSEPLVLDSEIMSLDTLNGEIQFRESEYK